MNFKNFKILGGVGALVMVLGGIPLALINRVYNTNIGGISLIVGIILILISLSSLAKIYQAKNIFTNARRGALAAIIGTILFTVVTVLLSPLTVNATLWLVLVILGVFYTVAAFFVRRSLNELAARSDMSLFVTAGRLLLIGAALTIVVIGVLIMWLAVLMLVVAFFTVKEPPSTPPRLSEN
jgi:uncharacterized membrane protein